MTSSGTSRRSLLAAGACVLMGASGMSCATGVLADEDASTVDKQNIIRTYYSGYEKKEWRLSGAVLADDFTFTSPNDDDHISKALFKRRCFLSQLAFIERFELEAVLVRGDEAFVMYLCRTKGAPFRNVDYFRFTGKKVSAIESFFGSSAGYPAAAAAQKP